MNDWERQHRQAQRCKARIRSKEQSNEIVLEDARVIAIEGVFKMSKLSKESFCKALSQAIFLKMR